MTLRTCDKTHLHQPLRTSKLQMHIPKDLLSSIPWPHTADGLVFGSHFWCLAIISDVKHNVAV